MESKYTVVGDFRQPHKDCEGETLTDLSYEEAVRIENEWKKEKRMLEMIEKVIRDGGNLHIEPALYGGDIFVCIDFPCLWGLNNATELSDATIVYEGTELKDTIDDICSPGDIRAIAVEDFLTDYAVKDPALLVARAENLQTALNHLEERLAEWYHLTDAQQKTILLSFAAERKKYLENVVQY